MAPDGRVDRSAVAGKAFASEEERKWLEELLWPRVGRRVWEWRQDVASRDPLPLAAVVEPPLLFEAGLDGIYDATIAVIAPEDVPYVRRALEWFGPGRLVFGSDWPVCLVAAPYTQVVSACRRAIGDVSAGDRERIFGGNAVTLYQIALPAVAR